MVKVRNTILTNTLLHLRLYLPEFSAKVQFGPPMRAVIPQGNIVSNDEIHAENINFDKTRFLGRPESLVHNSPCGPFILREGPEYRI